MKETCINGHDVIVDWNSEIILASGSARRTALLQQQGIPHRIEISNIEEKQIAGEAPQKMVCRLAEEKATNVADRFTDRIVLGADTIVYFQEQIIGKPLDLEHAARLYRKLSNHSHTVYTGTCLLNKNAGKKVVWHTVTTVTFRLLTDQDIQHCIETSNPLDKAGGYSIQDHESTLIYSMSGLRSNVIGLPVEEVVRVLRDAFEFNVAMPVNSPS